MSGKKRLREDAVPASAPALGEFDVSPENLLVMARMRKNSAPRRLLQSLIEKDRAGWSESDECESDSEGGETDDDDITPLNLSATFKELFGTIIRASEEVSYTWKFVASRFGPHLELVHEKRIADEGPRCWCRRVLMQFWVPVCDPNSPKEYALQFGADVITMQAS